MKKILFFILYLVFNISVAESATNEDKKTHYQQNLEKVLNNTNKDCGDLPKNHKQITELFIKSQLKDPDSAKFKHLEPTKCNFPAKDASKKTLYGCCIKYYYNAKNSFGGYVGYRLMEERWYQGKLYEICGETEYGFICSN